MAKSVKKSMTRREFVKAAAVGTAALGIAPSIFIPGQSSAASRELKILVWSHIVPRFDKEWFYVLMEAEGLRMARLKL